MAYSPYPSPKPVSDAGASARYVARYRAVASTSIERSELTFEPSVSEASLWAALNKQPQWWPDSAAADASTAGTDAERLALAKLRALFDFGARLGGATSGEITAALFRAYPDAEQLLRAQNQGAPAPRTMQFPVEARIREDGESEWGYSSPSQGSGKLPVGAERYARVDETGKSGLDIYIQNLVRADLYARLGH